MSPEEKTTKIEDPQNTDVQKKLIRRAAEVAIDLLDPSIDKDKKIGDDEFDKLSALLTTIVKDKRSEVKLFQYETHRLEFKYKMLKNNDKELHDKFFPQDSK